MDIRQAIIDDYDAVDVLLNAMKVDREVNRDLFTIMLKNRSCAILVVETDEKVVGMGICNLVSKLEREECRIDEVVVLEEYRGKGIGKALVTACEAWAWSHPTVQRVEFTSRPSRKEAHEFYKKLGYEIRDTVVFCKKRGEA